MSPTASGNPRVEDTALDLGARTFAGTISSDDRLHPAPLWVMVAAPTLSGGSAIIVLDSADDMPGSPIYFKVEKKPGLVVLPEVATFSASFHL